MFGTLLIRESGSSELDVDIALLAGHGTEI